MISLKPIGITYEGQNDANRVDKHVRLLPTIFREFILPCSKSGIQKEDIKSTSPFFLEFIDKGRDGRERRKV